MKNGVKQMQGVSAYIETHYEALAYCRQKKKICHYREHGKCSNHESIQCDGILVKILSSKKFRFTTNFTNNR